jgi:hypothetical protein
MTNLSHAEYQAAPRADFYSFMLRCFAELNPGASFLPSWHIEVMAAKLQAVRDGRMRRLIINIPPRHLKSLAASTALPAWLLGHDPVKAIVNVTYGQELSDKFARDCRAIMTSSWYQALFPTRLSSPRAPLQELVTTQGGFRLATSVGGVLTGRGADLIVIDDPLKPTDAMSESRRVAANEWFDGTLYSRLNDKTRGAIVIIMQRLHEDDLVGHVLKQEGWEMVSFPSIAENDEEHVVETPFGRKTFIRQTGAALHPERESLETLKRIRATLGEYNFAGQYQQTPAPAAAAWSRRPGSAAIAPTSGLTLSIRSSRAGIRQTSRRNSPTIPSAPPGASRDRTSISSTSCARSSIFPISSARCANRAISSIRRSF